MDGIEWMERDGRWEAEVNGFKLVQRPHPGAPKTHWIGFINDRLRVEGGSLVVNRVHLLRLLAEDVEVAERA